MNSSTRFLCYKICSSPLSRIGEIGATEMHSPSSEYTSPLRPNAIKTLMRCFTRTERSVHFHSYHVTYFCRWRSRRVALSLLVWRATLWTKSFLFMNSIFLRRVTYITASQYDSEADRFTRTRNSEWDAETWVVTKRDVIAASPVQNTPLHLIIVTNSRHQCMQSMLERQDTIH